MPRLGIGKRLPGRDIASAPTAMAMFDLEMRYVAASPGWREMYDLKENLIGKSHYEVFSDVPERWKEIHRRGLAGEILTSEDDEFVLESGRTVLLRWQQWPWHDDANKIAGIVVFTEDIAHRKEAEKRLRASRQLLEGIVENVPLTIFVKRASDLRFVLINQAAEEVFGYSKDDLLGKVNHEVWPKEQADEFTVADRRVLASKQVEKIVAEEITTPDGEVRYLDTWKAAVCDESGSAEYLIGISLDVTSRKTTEERLRQAQKLEAVGELTAGVAHDFNNLLSVVQGNLELMSDEAQNAPRQLKRIETAMNAVERGAALTQALLAFGRKQALSPRLVDLGTKVKNLATLLRHSIPESIALEIIVDPRRAPVRVDKVYLGNALINLAVNARDAMKAGGVLLISVGIEELKGESADAEALPAGRYGIITVQDTGSGMTPEVIAKAFDPFFTTKEIGQGSGLGLSMVYGFMRQSNGRVELSSTLGGGTMVKLSFPIVDEAKSEATDTLAIGSLNISPTKRRSVLVVEDIQAVREVVSEQLTALGFDVAAAADAASALSIPKEFELLVTDLGLPGGINGFELASTLTAKFPRTKVITMSGYNDAQTSGAHQPRPEWKHLRKPFARALLADAIKELFD